MKLFVSYRRAAWSFTYWLVEELGKLLDAEIFVDFSGIDESNFQSSLMRNLNESDAVLLIVSAETFAADRIHNDKDWVRREIREALALGKPMALALHNGLTPPADLPDDIQAVRDVQGVEFYPRYFKAGVRELAAFIGRSTPIPLRAPVATVEPAGVVDPAATERTLFDRATQLAEAGQYDPALEMLAELQSRHYRPRYVTLDAVIADITRDRDAELRRWEAGQHYDEIAALLRVNAERARAAWAEYRREYPEISDDPAGLGERLRIVLRPPPVVEAERYDTVASPHPQPLSPTPSTAGSGVAAPQIQERRQTQPVFAVTPKTRKHRLRWWLPRLAVALIGAMAVYVGVLLATNANTTFAPPIPTLPAANAANISTPTRNADWTAQSTSFGGVEMVLVPPGCFQMGSNDAEHEKPIHRQCIQSAFYLDRFEVTNAQFATFGGQAGRASYWTDPQRPRELITWAEARNFCAKRGGRLPTEAEWEWAARGPDNLLYPWGNNFVSDNVIKGSKVGPQTANVGSRPAGASWVGALDLSGNVREWTSTIYDQDKFPYPYVNSDGREYDINNTYRVVRGGSWDYSGSGLRSVNRDGGVGVYLNLGFRCARSS